jgi:Protein of unknown function (DUF998)
MRLLAVGTALYLLLGSIWAGTRRAGYRHLRHTISELGELGAPDARRIASGLFLPVGLSCLAQAALAAAHDPQTAASEAWRGGSALLAGSLAAGYLGAWLWPCDPGCPLTGSGRQLMHNVAGGIEYLGGALALQQLGGALPLDARTASELFRGAAALVVVIAIAFGAPPLAPWRGGLQRVAEAVLFLGLIVSSP